MTDREEIFGMLGTINNRTYQLKSDSIAQRIWMKQQAYTASFFKKYVFNRKHYLGFLSFVHRQNQNGISFEEGNTLPNILLQLQLEMNSTVHQDSYSYICNQFAYAHMTRLSESLKMNREARAELEFRTKLILQQGEDHLGAKVYINQDTFIQREFRSSPAEGEFTRPPVPQNAVGLLAMRQLGSWSEVSTRLIESRVLGSHWSNTSGPQDGRNIFLEQTLSWHNLEQLTYGMRQPFPLSRVSQKVVFVPASSELQLLRQDMNRASGKNIQMRMLLKPFQEHEEGFVQKDGLAPLFLQRSRDFVAHLIEHTRNHFLNISSRNLVSHVPNDLPFYSLIPTSVYKLTDSRITMLKQERPTRVSIPLAISGPSSMMSFYVPHHHTVRVSFSEHNSLTALEQSSVVQQTIESIVQQNPSRQQLTSTKPVARREENQTIGQAIRYEQINHVKENNSLREPLFKGIAISLEQKSDLGYEVPSPVVELVGPTLRQEKDEIPDAVGVQKDRQDLALVQERRRTLFWSPTHTFLARELESLVEKLSIDRVSRYGSQIELLTNQREKNLFLARRWYASKISLEQHLKISEKSQGNSSSNNRSSNRRNNSNSNSNSNRNSSRNVSNTLMVQGLAPFLFQDSRKSFHGATFINRQTIFQETIHRKLANFNKVAKLLHKNWMKSPDSVLLNQRAKLSFIAPVFNHLMSSSDFRFTEQGAVINQGLSFLIASPISLLEPYHVQNDRKERLYASPASNRNKANVSNNRVVKWVPGNKLISIRQGQSIQQMHGTTLQMHSIQQMQGTTRQVQSIEQIQGPTRQVQSIEQIQGPTRQVHNIEQMQGATLQMHSIEQMQGATLQMHSIEQMHGTTLQMHSIEQMQGTIRQVHNIEQIQTTRQVDSIKHMHSLKQLHSTQQGQSTTQSTLQSVFYTESRSFGDESLDAQQEWRGKRGRSFSVQAHALQKAKGLAKRKLEQVLIHQLLTGSFEQMDNVTSSGLDIRKHMQDRYMPFGPENNHTNTVKLSLITRDVRGTRLITNIGNTGEAIVARPSETKGVKVTGRTSLALIDDLATRAKFITREVTSLRHSLGAGEGLLPRPRGFTEIAEGQARAFSEEAGLSRTLMAREAITLRTNARSNEGMAITSDLMPSDEHVLRRGLTAIEQGVTGTSSGAGSLIGKSHQTPTSAIYREKRMLKESLQYALGDIPLEHSTSSVHKSSSIEELQAKLDDLQNKVQQGLSGSKVEMKYSQVPSPVQHDPRTIEFSAPDFHLESFIDQIYQELEKKIEFEQQRRGLN